MSEKNEIAWQVTIASAVNLILLIIIIAMSKSDAYAMGLGSSGERVCAVQRMLKNKGYYSGEINGIYDFTTRKSIKKFQFANSIEPDGEAKNETFFALGLNSENKYFSYETELLARYAQWKCGGKGYTAMLEICRKTLSESGENLSFGCRIIRDNEEFYRKIKKIEPSSEAVRAAVTAMDEKDFVNLQKNKSGRALPLPN